MATAANRGKGSERKVNEFLKKLETKQLAFTFNRIYDAHSAGGRFTSQAGDFQAFGWGRNWLLEVKEVAHDYRLRHNNFSPDSVGRMRKRHLAGSECVVVVYHSTTGLWRAPAFETFLTREGGSWDLRETPTQTLEEILACLCPPSSPILP